MTKNAAFPAICTRCEGTGTHQGGRCFKCRGSQVTMQKTSKVMRTFQHGITIDGVRKTFVTWGCDLAEATRCAEIVLRKQKLI